MLIRVDLPAPFSPMMPWIDPLAIVRLTFLLAWTAPKDLSMPRNSIAAGRVAADGDDASSTCSGAIRSVGAGVVAHVVGPLALAGDDVGARGLHLRLHVVGDQRLVVVIERPVDALLLEPEDGHAGLPGAVL